MTALVAGALLLPVPLAAVSWFIGRRNRRLRALVFLLAAAALALVLVGSGSNPGPVVLRDIQLGALPVNRLVVGIMIGALGAQALELLLRPSQSPGPESASLLMVPPGLLAMSATGMVPMAAAVGLLLSVVWVRWARAAGPQLPVRSLARQAVLLLAAMLGAAALTRSVEVGAAPGVLEATLVAAVVCGLVGALPLAIWVGSALRVGAAEAGLWRIWVLPVGAVLGARLVAGSPKSVALPLQELLVALGVASALFWAAQSIAGDSNQRYWRALGADAGFVAVGVGLGSPLGLAGALLLVVLHWLDGAVLGGEGGGRPQLLAWAGVSGIPPFGGFGARFVIILAAAPVSGIVWFLLVVALGLVLAGAARGMRSASGRMRQRVSHLREWVAMAASAASLVLGMLPLPVLAVLFGIHLGGAA